MNENKKLLAVLGIIVVIVGAIIISSVMGGKQQEKTLNEIDKLMSSKTEQVVYLGRPTCTYCQQFTPIMEELSDSYKYGYYYLNTDELSSSNLEKVLKKLGIDSSSFGTPTLAVVKDGKQVALQTGYTDREGLFKFLQEHSVIAKDATFEADDAHLNKVDYAQYLEVIKSEENQIVVFAQTGCSHCEEARPVLNAIAKEYNIKINYLNITDLSTNDQKDFANSLDVLKDGFGTPLTVVVKNGKTVDSLEGFESKDAMLKFFKKNNFIKE